MSCGLFLPVDGDKALWDFLFSHFNTTLFVFIYSLQKCVFSLGCILFKNQHFKSVELMWRMTSFITLDYNQSHFFAPLLIGTPSTADEMMRQALQSALTSLVAQLISAKRFWFERERARRPQDGVLIVFVFILILGRPPRPPRSHPLPLSSPQWQQIEL